MKNGNDNHSHSMMAIDCWLRSKFGLLYLLMSSLAWLPVQPPLLVYCLLWQSFFLHSWLLFNCWLRLYGSVFLLVICGVHWVCFCRAGLGDCLGALLDSPGMLNVLRLRCYAVLSIIRLTGESKFCNECNQAIYFVSFTVVVSAIQFNPEFDDSSSSAGHSWKRRTTNSASKPKERHLVQRDYRLLFVPRIGIKHFAVGGSGVRNLPKLSATIRLTFSAVGVLPILPVITGGIVVSLSLWSSGVGVGLDCLRSWWSIIILHFARKIQTN